MAAASSAMQGVRQKLSRGITCGFPKIRGTFLWGSGFLGSKMGSLYLGKLPYDVEPIRTGCPGSVRVWKRFSHVVPKP